MPKETESTDSTPETDSTDPMPVESATDGARPDRDELRVQALQRVFRRATWGDRSIGKSALRRFGAGLRGDLEE